MQLYIPEQIENIIKGMKIEEIKEGHQSGDLVYAVADLVIRG